MMTKSQVEKLQRDLNAFTDKRLHGVTHLRVDGDLGPATKKRIRFVKYYLGFDAAHRKYGDPTQQFLDRLAHPTSLRIYGRVALTRAIKRRAAQRRRAHAEESALHKKGFGTYDGKVVAAWMIPWFQKSRAHRCPRHPHGWQGTITSGVRTPAYSEHLCYVMCGHPTCPGRCAGRSSNHNMLPWQGEPHGAADVTFYTEFGEIQHEIGSPLHNALGAQDPVHFSVSGR